MKINALHDFICVEEPVKATTSIGGLVLLADTDSTLRCPVVSVGPGTIDEYGRELSVGTIKVGDVAHLPKEVLSGAPKTVIEGKTYMFVKPPQVLAWEVA